MVQNWILILGISKCRVYTNILQAEILKKPEILLVTTFLFKRYNLYFLKISFKCQAKHYYIGMNKETLTIDACQVKHASEGTQSLLAELKICLRVPTWLLAFLRHSTVSCWRVLHSTCQDRRSPLKNDQISWPESLPHQYQGLLGCIIPCPIPEVHSLKDNHQLQPH